MTSGGNGGIINGEQNSLFIAGALDRYSRRAECHALQYYESVRKMTSDVVKISENTGFSIDFVTTVKQHLFCTKHDLGGSELEYFYPDYDIAESWQRLALSKEAVLSVDIVLLQHEHLEARFMKSGMLQRQAHEKANEIYNYQKELLNKEKGV